MQILLRNNEIILDIFFIKMYCMENKKKNNHAAKNHI